MTPDATLAAIDGALHDLGTSGDAMRWQPDPERVICDGGGRLLRPEPWRRGHYDYGSSLAGIGDGPGVPIVGAAFQDRMSREGYREEWKM